ncbi:hypothetical protein [Burkholderia territorii]|uniref:hypothetical protein n=1 Tax=Burkholderia territorii TaxID=1503055 RepID=UPI000B26F9AF|nr:hypothetical protein [Burkholderia territorii]
MKITQESSFPALNIRLDTKEEVHMFFSIFQNYMTPLHQKYQADRYAFAKEIEGEARAHYVKFKDA